MRDNSVHIAAKVGSHAANMGGQKRVRMLGMKGTKMIPASTVTKSFTFNRKIK